MTPPEVDRVRSHMCRGHRSHDAWPLRWPRFEMRPTDTTLLAPRPGGCALHRTHAPGMMQRMGGEVSARMSESVRVAEAECECGCCCGLGMMLLTMIMATVRFRPRLEVCRAIDKNRDLTRAPTECRPPVVVHLRSKNFSIARLRQYSAPALSSCILHALSCDAWPSQRAMHQ